MAEPEPAPPTAQLGWREWAKARNSKARAKDRWRELETTDLRGAHGDFVNFAGNDYLGLSTHPVVIAAAQDALERWGAGAGASRLVSGTRPVHQELEAALAEWKACPSALVFSSGFAANLGVISTLGGPGTLILSDKLNHASIVDGCRVAAALGAGVQVYPHLRIDVLRTMLGTLGSRALVVSETVFSMDGDVAPVAALVDLCAQYDALLVLDEAHAVLGPHFGPLPAHVVRTGTLSKTLGSLGGFVAGDQLFIDLLVNRCRPFIYSTALSPADAAAARAALRVLRSEEGDSLLARLEAHVRRVAGPGPAGRSAIIPLIVGTDPGALAASAAFRQHGLLVPAIRPPTVPPRTSRLRVTLSAAHTDEDIDRLLAVMDELGLRPDARGGPC